MDKLHQSIPNPTDNLATINYSLNRGYRAANISIYTQNGKPVNSIKLNTTAGEGSIKVNLGNLTSGTYIYTLTADGRVVDSKKLQVIK
jgi:hypothetical protein